MSIMTKAHGVQCIHVQMARLVGPLPAHCPCHRDTRFILTSVIFRRIPVTLMSKKSNLTSQIRHNPILLLLHFPVFTYNEYLVESCFIMDLNASFVNFFSLLKVIFPSLLSSLPMLVLWHCKSL